MNANTSKTAPISWRSAMETALYGPRGFYRVGGGPARHFRTSAHVSPCFAAALWRLIHAVDQALGQPERLDVVDMGAGGGELLHAMVERPLSHPLAERARLVGIDLVERPAALPAEVEWRSTIPDRVTGVLLANEWLDTIPLDVAEVDPEGALRYVVVDPDTGAESLGGLVNSTDSMWQEQWWPAAGPGHRVELGASRDAVWAEAVGHLDAGLALAIDYGHFRADRPSLGSLAGYAAGRQVVPVPDGSCDVTADVAMDSVQTAGGLAAHSTGFMLRQRNALISLGVSGARPPRELASSDPSSYLRHLSEASAAAELIDPAGLGAFWWLAQPVKLDEAEAAQVAEVFDMGGSAT